MMHDPFVDWVYMIVLWTICVAGVTCLGVYVYVSADAQISAAPAPTQSAHVFDEALLLKASGSLDIRDREHADLKRSYSASHDPSILP